MKKTEAKPKPERIEIRFIRDGVAVKRIIETLPGTSNLLYEGVMYERTSQLSGLHGHPGATTQPYVSVFLPMVPQPDARCRGCSKRGYALDEFTSPWTGLCRECADKQKVGL